MSESVGTWNDITASLDELASQLSLGELFHDEAFSLQRTMTAVVVGSDRMDTASKEVAEDPYALVESAIASVPEITQKNKLAIMDQILTLQASYHLGTGLGRSVYTCLYFFKLQEFELHSMICFIDCC